MLRPPSTLIVLGAATRTLAAMLARRPVGPILVKGTAGNLSIAEQMADDSTIAADSNYVLNQGIDDTRAALDRWAGNPGPVLGSWFAGALGVSVLLLSCVWIVSQVFPQDPTFYYIPGFSFEAGVIDYLELLGKNFLVLALHATACVAGFIGGSSMHLEASRRKGFDRWIHEKAGPIAIWWVVGITTFSLITQAYALGLDGSALAGSLDLSVFVLILTVLPHALIELVAVFLPLAAWLIASRHDQWEDLLAATVVTTAIAVPMLLLSASIELWIWPQLLEIAAF